MTKPKSKVSSTKTVPKGPAAAGSTKPVRGKPNKRVDVSKPHEVPCYVTYERHCTEKDLLGWTVAIEAWMTSSRVEVKIGRIPYRIEVWVDGKLVHAKNLKRGEVNTPITENDGEDFSTISEWFAAADLGLKTDGWVTQLGKQHAAEKDMEQRRTGRKKDGAPIVIPGRISGDDIIIEEDDSEDEIIWED